MEQPIGNQGALVHIEKGLRSSTLAEQLATITNCVTYVNDNPFPLFVNTVLVRLAEAFQGDAEFMNVVRLRIVRTVKECGSNIRVAFSSDEIVRRIMKVSHSNDYKARSLTLLFLEALAPIIHSNKKVHHLLIESLDSSDEIELMSAISAVAAFGKHSSEFSAAIIEKIGEMAYSSQRDVEVKVRLVQIMANFRETFDVTKSSLLLGTNLLRLNFNRKLAIATINSLTKLAARSGLAVAEQITLLLTELQRVLPNHSLSLCMLVNLRKLADFPHRWTQHHLTTLREVYERIRETNLKPLLCVWLDCVASLSSTVVHSNDIIERNFPWPVLISDSDILVRIPMLHLIVNMLTRRGSSHLQGILVATLISTLEEVPKTNTSRDDKKKLLALLALYVRDASCAESVAMALAKALMNIPKTFADHDLVLEALNAVLGSKSICK
ncbi:integrator complex subunit 7-like [Aphelenchoides avenae]|nr:integrator complex subunit 7-like [Aphelenchus avenae]